MYFSGNTSRFAFSVAGAGTTLLLLALLHGCAGGGRAPVADRGGAPSTARTDSSSQQTKQQQREIPRSGYHTVNRGDTLYAIAWRYGLDYRDVARWNNIRTPYTIYPGKRLRLRPAASSSLPSMAKSSPQLPSPPVKREPSAPVTDSSRPSPPLPRSQSTRTSPPVKAPAKQATATKQAVPAKQPTPAAIPSGPVQWHWPAQGKLVHANSPTGEKGIKISGKLNQSVAAAAPGQVVYSGSGLIGYGKLIIIKHNETFLSAYAHNNELLVKEGDSVKAGQKIATMGAGSDGRAALHFEIRRNGQPIDPLKHLPARQG